MSCKIWFLRLTCSLTHTKNTIEVKYFTLRVTEEWDTVNIWNHQMKSSRLTKQINTECTLSTCVINVVISCCNLATVLLLLCFQVEAITPSPSLPTNMCSFKSFSLYISKLNKYGTKYKIAIQAKQQLWFLVWIKFLKYVHNHALNCNWHINRVKIITNLPLMRWLLWSSKT